MKLLSMAGSGGAVVIKLLVSNISESLVRLNTWLCISSGAGDPRCKIAIVMGCSTAKDMPKYVVFFSFIYIVFW